jgi:hypothetical protein
MLKIYNNDNYAIGLVAYNGARRAATWTIWRL